MYYEAVIDCTDLEIAAPEIMCEERMIYSTYRGMNSFKTLIGVAPNAVITHVSKLFPGSTSDKAIVENSGVLSNFTAGDLILADKGFLINDVVPDGVTINISKQMPARIVALANCCFLYCLVLLVRDHEFLDQKPLLISIIIHKLF